ncbi:MAG: ferredoxin [Pseudomonadota bacterium]
MVRDLRDDRDVQEPQDHSGFFVAPDECLAHGCCHYELPDVFEWRKPANGAGPMVVARQPKTEQELRLVALAMFCCPVNAIYYGGNNRRVISAIRKQGVSSSNVLG